MGELIILGFVGWVLYLWLDSKNGPSYMRPTTPAPPRNESSYVGPLPCHLNCAPDRHWFSSSGLMSSCPHA
jgi:hypothetical protein